MIFFLFLKNHFWHQHIKTIENVQTILNFSKKKKSNFLEKQVQTRSQTLPKISEPSHQFTYSFYTLLWKSICHEITLPWDMRGLYQIQSRKIIKLNQTTFFKPNFWRFNGPMNDKVASIGYLVVESYGKFLAKSDLLLLLF
jgi:hypothetical protein